MQRYNRLANSILINKINANRHMRPKTFFTIVQQGTEAYRLFLGKNPIKLDPGIHYKIPLIHNVMKVDMREGSYNIDKLNAYTKDNVAVKISGSLFYQVTNSYNACFKIQDYHNNIISLGMSAMRSVVGLFHYDEVIADRQKINDQLANMIGTASDAWGIKCVKFEIQTFIPANKDVEHQLEKQLEAERNRRKQILDTEASVNIADGKKRSMILESEGKLIAAKNEADAEYEKTKKQADGNKYLIDQETLGLNNQLNTMAQTLGSPELAAKYLIEQNKLKHLQSIASNNNNNTYFLPEKDNVTPNIKLFSDINKS